VAAGILASRIVGLVRQRAIAHYLGLTTEAADAWAAGFRIPNLVQNLFGEGALSGSFIPVYATLLAQGRRQEADRVAGAVIALLGLFVSVIVLAGVAATPLIIDVVAPGFAGEKRALTITVVRILFPGAGLLVFSAWCLGVLNSHRHFLLSYAAPIVWSLAMIAALLWFGGATELPRLVVILAWASVLGSALQCAVQLPSVVRLAPELRLMFDTASADVQAVLRNFLPTCLSRGVVQVSAYVDTILASWLPTGAIAGLTNAQTLYTLPVSLFGMSVSAAELPALSSAAAERGTYDQLRARLDSGLRNIAFLVVPSAVVFFTLGDVVAAAVLQTGRFQPDDVLYIWGILAGSAVGLLASTLGRLYAATYFALRDTRTPLRYAVIRVILTTALGYVAAILAPGRLGLDPSWGAAGLTASAGLAGWFEMLLLRRTLSARIGRTGLSAGYATRLWGAAAVGAAIAWIVKRSLPPLHPMATAVVVLLPYGLAYFASTMALSIPEGRQMLRRLV
jgi:putative peptidoglycan lipid II flippase